MSAAPSAWSALDAGPEEQEADQDERHPSDSPEDPRPRQSTLRGVQASVPRQTVRDAERRQEHQRHGEVDKLHDPTLLGPRNLPGDAARSEALPTTATRVVRRSSRAAGRSRRWDAGPAPTARDLVALRFVGEQYAVRVDVATVLLTRLSATGPERGSQLSRRAVREQLGRWEQAGWAERRRLLGHTWVTLTRTGLRLAGLDYEVWSPALDRLDHHHAASVVRLHREPIPGQGGWVCERALWRRRGKASWHLADAALPMPVPTSWEQQGISEAWELVEVELTQKARPRVVAALKTRPPHTASVTYYVPPALLAALAAQLASVVRELGGRPEVRVELLPEVAGTSYGGGR